MDSKQNILIADTLAEPWS